METLNFIDHKGIQNPDELSEEKKSEYKRIHELAKKTESRLDHRNYAENYYFFFNTLDEKEINNSDEKRCKEILSEHLAGKTLVDLGCGGQYSLYAMGELASRFMAKEIIAVDKKFDEKNLERDISEDKINAEVYLDMGIIEHKTKLRKQFYKKLHPEVDTNRMYFGSPKLTTEESSIFLEENGNILKNRLETKVVESDMLEFLFALNEKVNIVMNGIDWTIIDPQKNHEYVEELFNQIDRCVPEDGLVFGMGSGSILHFLEKKNFKKIMSDSGSHPEIWQKLKTEKTH